MQTSPEHYRGAAHGTTPTSPTDPPEELYELAIRSWVARRTRVQPAQIRNVRFGVGEGWAGSEVTPGEPDYAAVVYELRNLEGRWITEHTTVPRPAEMVQECLAILAELYTGSPTSAEVDQAIDFVQRAHWGPSLKPPGANEGYVRFVRIARTLAAEVRRLRGLIPVRHV